VGVGVDVGVGVGVGVGLGRHELTYGGLPAHAVMSVVHFAPPAGQQ
jgi:hypothetical protein